MNKGKEIQKKQQTYKSAITERSEKIVKKEALKATSKDEKMREDAYKLALDTPKEYVFPYIPSTTIWISPIESKYLNLSAEEVMNFYLRNFTDPYIFPKDYYYYQQILEYTGSVQFGGYSRDQKDYENIAYSKATIQRILVPEQWDGDLYRAKEMIPDSKHSHRNKMFFNYFDYIKAWDIAFCYENKTRKHSWFIQFRNPEGIKFPNWFVKWFSEWGLYPIILPHKVRIIFEDFVKMNPSLKNHSLMFSAFYQVPWIFKWDVLVSRRKIEKFDTSFEIPYLGRRVCIKWWEKYDFFKDSIFTSKGLISFEPIVEKKIEPKKTMEELLAELLAGSSKKDLKKKIKAILADSSSGDESEDDETQKMDTDEILQESQSP